MSNNFHKSYQKLGVSDEMMQQPIVTAGCGDLSVALTSPNMYGWVAMRMNPIRFQEKKAYKSPDAQELIYGSFVKLMQRVGKSGMPDNFLFTADSGIISADAVDGYCKELGVKTPQLLPIYLHQMNGVDEIERESMRLHSMIDGSKSVVVDEYVFSSYTLRASILAAMMAGSTVVAHTNHHTNWYGERNKTSMVDIENMTSVHRPFMFEVGRLAARIVDDQSQRFWLDSVADLESRSAVRKQVWMERVGPIPQLEGRGMDGDYKAILKNKLDVFDKNCVF